MAVLGAVVLLINLPVLHLGAASSACGSSSPHRRLHRSGHRGAQLATRWGYPGGERPAPAGHEEQPSWLPPRCLRTWWSRSQRPTSTRGIRGPLGSGKEPESGYQATGSWSLNGRRPAFSSLVRLDENARRSPAGWEGPRPGDPLGRLDPPRLRVSTSAARPQPRLPDALRAAGAGAPLTIVDGTLMAELNDPSPGGPGHDSSASQRRVGRVHYDDLRVSCQWRRLAPSAPHRAAPPVDDFARTQLGQTGWPPIRRR